MRVTTEISEDMFGRSEWRLGIDDPVLAPQPADCGGEGLGIVKPIQLAREAQPPGHIRRFKPFEEQSAEQA